MRVDPLLFMLDEPTASLDAPSEHAIFEHYMRRARNLAATSGAVTLVVSHRLSNVAGADLVLVLHNGTVVEQDSHQQLLAAGGRYGEMYRRQADAYTHRPAIYDWPPAFPGEHRTLGDLPVVSGGRDLVTSRRVRLRGGNSR